MHTTGLLPEIYYVSVEPLAQALYPVYQYDHCCHTLLCEFLMYQYYWTFGLNIFYSEEKDWVWHKTQHNPLQKYNAFTHTFTPTSAILKNQIQLNH